MLQNSFGNDVSSQPALKPAGDVADLSGTDIEIGIEAFDAEHRDILDQIKIVCHAAISDKSFDYLTNALATLLVLAKTHFDHEERRMAQSAYAGLHVHAEDHRILEWQLETFIAAVTSDCSSSAERLQCARSFFRRWLVDHILHYDHALTRVVEQAAVAPLGA